MADPGLTDADLEPAAQHVIDVYLADLSTRLVGPAAARAAILAELEDGLRAATASHQSMGLPRRRRQRRRWPSSAIPAPWPPGSAQSWRQPPAAGSAWAC
jgi:hypothetical protein